MFGSSEAAALRRPSRLQAVVNTSTPPRAAKRFPPERPPPARSCLGTGPRPGRTGWSGPRWIWKPTGCVATGCAKGTRRATAHQKHTVSLPPSGRAPPPDPQIPSSRFGHFSPTHRSWHWPLYDLATRDISGQRASGSQKKSRCARLLRFRFVPGLLHFRHGENFAGLRR